MRKPALVPLLLPALFVAGSPLGARVPRAVPIDEPACTARVDTASIVQTGGDRERLLDLVCVVGRHRPGQP